MHYKTVVKEIQELPWKDIYPFSIILVSLASAQEFAASLRCACRVYPGDLDLRLMALGELNTSNLKYGGYRVHGDHSRFLEYFVKKLPTHAQVVGTRATAAVTTYNETIERMSAEHRAQTVFSREAELPGIFEAILAAHDWDKHGFGFYRYYLERHIELDSGPEGHGELTNKFELDPAVLLHFYNARLKLYADGLQLR